MSKNQDRIIKALKDRGFTDETDTFQLFYWANDGWYAHCDQMGHNWIGQNTPHVLQTIAKGDYDYRLSW